MSSYLDSNNNLKNIIFIKNAINLTTLDFIHETIHAIQCYLKKLFANYHYESVGIQYDRSNDNFRGNFDLKKLKFSKNSEMCEDEDLQQQDSHKQYSYSISNEMYTEFFASEITKILNSRNIFIGYSFHTKEEYGGYKNLFLFTHEFIKKYKEHLKKIQMESDFVKYEEMFGKENVMNFDMILDEIFDFGNSIDIRQIMIKAKNKFGDINSINLNSKKYSKLSDEMRQYIEYKQIINDVIKKMDESATKYLESHKNEESGGDD